MRENDQPSVVTLARQGQMLRLVAKGFYNELVKYGVSGPEVLRVAGHLLDNLNQKPVAEKGKGDYYNRLFKVSDVMDDWAASKRLKLQQVSISPLNKGLVPEVAAWLRAPAIRDSFYPSYPESEGHLATYFEDWSRDYLTIYCGDEAVGIIGAEQIDREALKLEMRKLVGDPRMHGKGIGKRATMLFLYYVFVILRYRKVFVHSLDINVRNLNLNARFGFELEGTLFEDAWIQNTRRDVVRMALSAPVWLGLFS